MTGHYEIKRISYLDIVRTPDQELVAKMRLWGQIMGRLEMVPYVTGKGWAGNIGFRKDGIIWVTPSGAAIDNIKQEEIMGVTQGIESIFYFGHPEKKPTSEWEIYWEIFKKRPEINAVLHGHDLFTLETAEQLKRDYPEQVSLTNGVTDSGTWEFRDELSEIITNDNSYLIGREHGFFALGNNFEEAGMLALDFRSRASRLLIGDETHKNLLKKYHIC